MTRNLLVATCFAALAVSTSALAQPTPPAAAVPIVHGPPIANVCLVSLEGALGQSTVGKYIETRMQQIISQVQAELNAEATIINNEARALDAQRASLDQNAFEKRASDLQVRENARQRKAQLRDRELQATEQKALARASQEMSPLVIQVYQQRQCGLLLRAEAVVTGNGAMDITPNVVTALNGKITQFAFERERLEQGPTAGAPAAAAPAAPVAPAAPARPAPARRR